MQRRIRRNTAVAIDTSRIDALMKSISTAQDEVANQSAIVKQGIAELYILMKAAKMDVHKVGTLTAEMFRPAGRGSTYIDPEAFRKMVKNDADFYSAISVGVTAAKKVVAQKQLDTITTTKAATPGEEQVRVSRG